MCRFAIAKFAFLGLCLFGTIPTLVGQIESEPLGNTLNHALELSSLTAPGSKPFHIKISIDDPDSDSNTYKASVEEYWVSPALWKRIVVAPGISQVTVANETGVHFQNSGDYFPVWLQNMITSLENPVPLANEWNKGSAKLESRKLPNGAKTIPCLIGRSLMGLGTVKGDAFSNVCFLGTGELREVTEPGYAFEFHDYRLFGKKRVSYLRIEKRGIGAEIDGEVTLLNGVDKPYGSLFATPTGSTTDNSFAAIKIEQSGIERMAGGTIPIVWPTVEGGKTEGVCTFYVSVDRAGHVREAYPLNSDNPGMNSAASSQLVKMQWKPANVHGNMVQVESAVALGFTTTIQHPVTSGTSISSDPQNTANIFPVPVSSDVMRGAKLSGAAPLYPESARQAHIQGTVLLRAIIGKDGIIKRVRVLDSPDPSLSNAAIEAVHDWKYRPYLLNGQPVEVHTTITANFGLGPTTTKFINAR